MELEKLVAFQIALEDLAKAHKLQLVQAPLFTYGSGGIRQSGGVALWPTYDVHGNITTDFCVRFTAEKSV